MGVDVRTTLDGLRDTLEEKEAKRLDAVSAMKKAESEYAMAETRRANAQTLVASFDRTIKDIRAAISALGALDPHATMKREGRELPDISLDHTLLHIYRIRSETRQNTFYSVEVRLYGKRLVLACDCMRWRFTHGVIANGDKKDCKHITRFRFDNAGWLRVAASDAIDRNSITPPAILDFEDVHVLIDHDRFIRISTHIR